MPRRLVVPSWGWTLEEEACRLRRSRNKIHTAVAAKVAAAERQV